MLNPLAPRIPLLSPGDSLRRPLAWSLALHGVVGLLGVGVALWEGEKVAPLREPVMIVEPLYALPISADSLPGRPMMTPDPPAGEEGEVEEPEVPPDAMALPDPEVKKKDGEEKSPDDKAERDRKKKEAMEKLANLEKGDRNQAPTAENAIIPPDWSTWNPSGSANADPQVGRWVAQAKDRLRKNLFIINPSVVKNSPEFYVGVAVLLDRDGNIVDFEVSRSSGEPRFDQYVKTAVKKTRILPRPEDKVWSLLTTSGRYQQGAFLVQLSGKDVSLQ